ncbi:MAG: hypothetical protein E6G66_08530 [Actinobacteria bacterium]|nr:MAG: hypothetical protein E6G66_08530 [Actinomycetota bacterium]
MLPGRRGRLRLPGTGPRPGPARPADRPDRPDPANLARPPEPCPSRRSAGRPHRGDRGLARAGCGRGRHGGRRRRPRPRRGPQAVVGAGLQLRPRRPRHRQGHRREPGGLDPLPRWCRLVPPHRHLLRAGGPVPERTVNRHRGQRDQRGGGRRDDLGFLTIWLLGLCLLLLVLGGVSLDLWRVFSERQALAGLADSASLAGAAGLDLDAARRGLVRLDPADAAGRARASIAAQADKGSLVLSSVNIVVRQDRSEVTVSADGQVHLILLRLLLGDRPVSLQVSSTAVARSS